MSETTTRKIDEVVGAAVRQLVTSHSFAGAHYLNLPLLYRMVARTVKTKIVLGGFIVTDNGFAYREVEAIGYERSFVRPPLPSFRSETLRPTDGQSSLRQKQKKSSGQFAMLRLRHGKL